MANERSADLILKAQVDQALQPLAQVTQRVKDLILVLDQQRQAAKTGDTSLGEYAKALRDVERASGDLLKQRAALDNFATRGQKVDTQQNVVDANRQRRDALAASLPSIDDRSTKDAAALAKLDKALESSQKRLDTLNIAYQRSVDQLERLGVLTANLAAGQQRLRLDQANSTVSASVLEATEALRAGQVVSDTLVATLRLAGVEKQVAEQRQRDTARFLADQEKQRKAVLDAAEAVRTQGAAAQARVDASTATASRRFDVEQAFATADAEAKLAAQRTKDANAFQAEQRKLADAVTSVWAAENAAAEKARKAFLDFQATVEKAVAQANSAVGHAASQTSLLGVPVAAPATTLAAQVRSLVVSPSSPGTGHTDLDGLRAQVAAIEATVQNGTSGFKEYTQGLKELDAVSREVVRQSQIVDNFQKQRKAAIEAMEAVQAAAEELKRLQSVAASATTPDQVSEVTSAITAQRRRIGSVSDNTGLLGEARAQQEALAREEAALNSIGVAADKVSLATTRLTQVAIDTSTTRQHILAKEKATYDAEADDIIRRAAALTTAATTSTPTARGAVAAVTGATRSGQEIEDTTAAIEKLEASMGKGKLTAQQYNTVMDSIFATQSQIAKDASLIDQFTSQSAAVNKSAAAYKAAQAEVARLATAYKNGTASIEELRRAEASLNSAASDLQRQATLQAQLDTQLKARKLDTTQLAAETDKLVASMARLSTVQNSVQQGNSKVLGLSAYQFQNLQFQVNDVITQLSLGQGVLRTFEAQAGQIFQIFDLSVTALQRIALYGAPAAAVIITIGLALLRLKDSNDAQRQFAAQLQISADGMAYQAKALTQTARVIEGFGVSFDDAKTAVKGFVTDGLSIGTMVQFAKTAQNIADVTGGTFVEALKQISVIATGSYADILKLNDSLNFLHDGELQAIRDSFEFNDGSNGRTVALNALTTATTKARNEGIDPLTQGTRNLKQAWHEFLDAIGSTQVLTGLVGMLTNLTKLASDTANALRYILNPTQGEANQKVIVLQAALKDIQADIKAIGEGKKPASGETLEVLTAQARELQNQINLAIIARDKLAAPAPGALPGTGAGGLPFGTASLLGNLPAADSRVSRAIPPEMLAILAGAAGAANVKEGDLQALYKNEAAQNADGTFKTSSAGAAGPLQVLPDTFKEVVQKFQGLFDALSQILGKKIDINTPEFNALAGALFFKMQTDAFGGNTALAAGAYNLGAGSQANGTGLRGVLSGQKALPPETAQYIANFLASTGQGGASLPGVVHQPGLNNADAAKNQVVLDDIAKRQTQDIDSLLRGDARLLQDQQLLAEFSKTRNQEIDQQLGTTPRSSEVTSKFNAEIDRFAKKLQDAREKEEREANNTATQIIKSAQEAIDKADKTNPEAQRRAVSTQFDAQLSALNNQIANGATDIAGQTAVAARDGLLKLRQQAIENATIEADKAIVDAVVKTRDEKITAVNTDLKTGAITLGQAFDAIATIVRTFGPKIQQAITRSNTDLSAQPQTPKIAEALAANSKINVAGSKAFEDIDAAALVKINDLISARGNKVKEINDEVTRGQLTQRQADDEVQKAYAQVNPQLNGLITATQDMIDLQLKQSVISDETYQKLTSQLKKAQTETTTLTSFQAELGKTLENSIERNGIQAFDTIGQALGNVVAGTGKWSDVLKSVGTAFANFAAGVLKDLANMIIKWELLNAIQSSGGGAGLIGKLFGTGASAAAGASGSAASVGEEGGQFIFSAHSGGIVGSLTQSRVVDASVFANARRFHSGGMPGLAPGEIPVITQQGEEILTQKDPRHRNNMTTSKQAVAPQSIRNVMLFDPEEVAGAMAGTSGEQVVFTHIKRNAPALRALLGSR